VADVTGAGDMVLSVLGLVAAARGSLDAACELANVAAGIEIRYLGVTPISREELLQELKHEGHPVVSKIKRLEDLVPIARAAKEAGRVVVFTNGCFDLLHLGHHELLNGARREGDLLIVAVNSDASVRRLKGPGRPRINQENRVLMLAGLEAVDYVVVFDEDTPDHLLAALRPDVLVKGSEYRSGVVVGREIVEGYGGRVAFVEQVPGISTTAILQGQAERGERGS
jgi:D-beta-D-heptose 7-phosphate kinase/D-beta-D-heptose 1-phosphate adenosyltransferase